MIGADEDVVWVIPVLNQIHQRLLDTHDMRGLRRLARMDDDELVQLARHSLDTWSPQ